MSTLPFHDFIKEDIELKTEETLDIIETLDEALVKFGGVAYPKFGQFVILAGGGGSGKGFVRSNLLGVEGMVFDVDFLKILVLASAKIKAKIKAELGDDLDKFDLKDEDDVSRIHAIVNDYLHLDDKKISAAMAVILTAAKDRKPNIIFDVTLKDLLKFQKLTKVASDLGYEKKNVHLTWIINDIEVAKAQNASRERRVNVDLLINTHRGVSATMHDVINLGTEIQRYMDGDITLVFNQAGVDSEVMVRDKTQDLGVETPVIAAKSKSRGFVITKQDYVVIKKAGQKCKRFEEIADAVKRKIASYVPKGISWA